MLILLSKSAVKISTFFFQVWSSFIERNSRRYEKLCAIKEQYILIYFRYLKNPVNQRGSKVRKVEVNVHIHHDIVLMCCEVFDASPPKNAIGGNFCKLQSIVMYYPMRSFLQDMADVLTSLAGRLREVKMVQICNANGQEGIDQGRKRVR
jgi:hypothetical protein